MRLGRLLVCVLAAGSLAAPALAQRPQQQRAQPGQERARLEGDIRRGFARAVRQRVGLSEDQMRRLGPVTQRHEQQRRQLQMEERRTRMALHALLRDSSADSSGISQHLQTLVDLQKRRVQVLEAEHRDLATIMTPLQRARYMAVQEQLRRRMEQMRQRRGG